MNHYFFCDRSIGVANFNIHHLKELQSERPDNLPVGKYLSTYQHCKSDTKTSSVPVNQIEIHPFLAWNECVSFCQEESIAVMAYSPLTKAEKLNDRTLCKIARQQVTS